VGLLCLGLDFGGGGGGKARRNWDEKSFDRQAGWSLDLSREDVTHPQGHPVSPRPTRTRPTRLARLGRRRWARSAWWERMEWFSPTAYHAAPGLVGHRTHGTGLTPVPCICRAGRRGSGRWLLAVHMLHVSSTAADDHGRKMVVSQNRRRRQVLKCYKGPAKHGDGCPWPSPVIS
jgi:hypothetical protein